MFADRRDCFIPACDELQRELLESLYEQAGAPAWLDALRRGLDIYLAFWFIVRLLADEPTTRRALAGHRTGPRTGAPRVASAFVAIVNQEIG